MEKWSTLLHIESIPEDGTVKIEGKPNIWWIDLEIMNFQDEEGNN